MNDAKIQKEYFSIPELEKLSGMGRSLIRNHVESGALKASNVAAKSTRAKWSIHINDWKAFFESRSNQQASKPCRQQRTKSKPRRKHI